MNSIWGNMSNSWISKILRLGWIRTRTRRSPTPSFRIDSSIIESFPFMTSILKTFWIKSKLKIKDNKNELGLLLVGQIVCFYSREKPKKFEKKLPVYDVHIQNILNQEWTGKEKYKKWMIWFSLFQTVKSNMLIRVGLRFEFQDARSGIQTLAEVTDKVHVF